jgi:hypothetical protein
VRCSVVAPSPSRAPRVRRAVPLLAVRSLLLFCSTGTSIHCRIDGSPSGFFTSGDCLSPSSCSGVYLILAAGSRYWAEGEVGQAGGCRLNMIGLVVGNDAYVCGVLAMERRLPQSRACVKRSMRG